MKKIFLNKITKQGKALFLAYDQGLEHGPLDFNDKNVDPLYVIDIAKKGKYTGIVFQKGIAEKYRKEIKRSKIPLIVKLNGKTNLVEGDPISLQLCSVDEAVKLGARAVGYTLYIGSKHESLMFQEFELIQKQAHSKGIPVIAWIYPRGSGLKDRKETELMAYATRAGLELGADIIKIHPVGDLKDLKWAVKSAGKAMVVAAGGSKTNEGDLLNQAKNYTDAGFAGLAIGRNVWQSENPLELTKKIKKIIFS
ncbi:MAG TPA: fructose-bisphosphate aldolase [Candidatus Nanoarchaeia archaeon]|nr:fructose-bisphosphate aldolase [Candidatus Nanoarchaeia archaeon]